MNDINNLYSCHNYVRMDDNHIHLIYSLVICSKPKSILEIGIGSGSVTDQLIKANTYNEIDATITCVDNFYDWNGNPPPEYEEIKKIRNIQYIISDEQSFVKSCNTKYDFIISDADHHHAHLWIDKTFEILNTNGILIYHDITNPQFINLSKIVEYVKDNNINHMIFNQSSLKSERCERGLLVIKK